MELRKLDEERIPDSYFLFGYLQTLSNQIQTAGDHFFRDISMKQWFALIAVQIYPYAPTLQEVTEVVGSSRQNVKQLLLKLEKLSYLEIIADEEDHRKQRMILTEKAKQFLDIHEKAGEESMKALFAGVPEEELKVTRKVLTKLGDNLQDMWKVMKTFDSTTR